MPKGGTPRIETKTTTIDDSHGYGKPGEYVLLSVFDNGCGMKGINKRSRFLILSLPQKR
jgi:hypothetical protein